MKHLFLKIATTTLTLSSCATLQAAVMLSGGLSHDYNLQPGGKVTRILELRNTGSKHAEVKIYQEDVRVTGNGETQFVKVIGSHPRSNAKWINIETERVTLAPGAHQKISYTLRVPQNTNMQGSYWSTLMLEPISSDSAESQLVSQESTKSNLNISQKMRYGVRILTEVGNQGAANLIFSPPKITKNATGERWFSVDIRNQGNSFTRPNVWLDVFDAQGRKVGKFEAASHAMYAGELENFQVNIAGLQAGNYKALLAAEDNRSGQVFGSDINLNIKP